MAEEAESYRILFVCTGNIFRSLTADVALRKLLAGDPEFHVSSAGTDDYPHIVRPYTGEYLRSKGFEIASHRRRTYAAPSTASSSSRRGWHRTSPR